VFTEPLSCNDRRDTQKRDREKRKRWEVVSPVLKVPRQCLLVLLIGVE
jgi:hypothetical protein